MKTIKQTIGGILAVFMIVAPFAVVAAPDPGDFRCIIRNADDTADIIVGVPHHSTTTYSVLGQRLNQDGCSMYYHDMDDFNMVSAGIELHPENYIVSVREEGLDIYDLQNSTAAFAAKVSTSTHATDIANAKDRANHTGSQAISTVTGLQTALDGKFAVPTGNTSQYIRGDGSVASMPAQENIQSVRVQTNGSGAYTWTFPTPFDETPRISIEVESNVAGLTTANITAVSSTSVSVQTARAINVLGILTLQSSPQLYVHIMAHDD